VFRFEKNSQVQTGLMDRAALSLTVYSGSAIPFADILSMLDERLEVLHVL
jgi:hypothetical protein